MSTASISTARSPFWNDIVAHPDYDEFWAARSTLPHLKNITCAVLVVGGLFDAEDLYGIFHTYAAIEEAQSRNLQHLRPRTLAPRRVASASDGRSLGDADFGFATATDFGRACPAAVSSPTTSRGAGAGDCGGHGLRNRHQPWRVFRQLGARERAEEALLYLDAGGTSVVGSAGRRPAIHSTTSSPTLTTLFPIRRPSPPAGTPST